MQKRTFPVMIWGIFLVGVFIVFLFMLVKKFEKESLPQLQPARQIAGRVNCPEEPIQKGRAIPSDGRTEWEYAFCPPHRGDFAQESRPAPETTPGTTQGHAK